MKDELIRDRLVMGISDKKVSQQLRTDPKLTVEKAKLTIRQKAAVQQQGRELEAEKKRGESLETLEKTIAEMQLSMDELKHSSKQRFSRRGRRNGKQPMQRPRGLAPGVAMESTRVPSS